MVSNLPVLGVLLPHKPKPPLRFFFTIPIVFLLKLSSLQSSVFGQFHYVILVQSVSEFFVLLLSTTHSFNKIYIFHHTLILTVTALTIWTGTENKTRIRKISAAGPTMRCHMPTSFYNGSRHEHHMSPFLAELSQNHRQSLIVWSEGPKLQSEILFFTSILNAFGAFRHFFECTSLASLLVTTAHLWSLLLLVVTRSFSLVALTTELLRYPRYCYLFAIGVLHKLVLQLMETIYCYSLGTGDENFF
jgi:hypothetical protein